MDTPSLSYKENVSFSLSHSIRWVKGNFLSWPGRLDVTVGGGIGSWETPSSTIIRECAEEASLDPDFVAQNIRSAGVLSFPNCSPAGWILPGLYYLFDLPLQADGTPERRRGRELRTAECGGRAVEFVGRPVQTKFSARAGRLSDLAWLRHRGVGSEICGGVLDVEEGSGFARRLVVIC